jgi:hypothetical protein
MTLTKKIDALSAINLLKSGKNLDNVVISDLETSRIRAMDALLLAKNGYLVPDGNIVYDDNDIAYDPDFDDVEWGQPISFREFKQSLSAENGNQETTELVLKVQVQNLEMKQWLKENKEQLSLVVNGLIESMYKAEQLPKV